MRRISHRLALPLVLATTCLFGGEARAASAVVPDDFPTIRLAIEAQMDTVLVRSGDYPERLRMRLGFSQMPSTKNSLVLMAHPGESGLPRPRLASVELVSADDSQGTLECRGLRIGGALFLNGSENGSHNPMLVESCELDSGLYVGDSQTIVRSCRIRGRAIFHYSFGGFVSDTLIQGGVIVGEGEGDVSVVGCTFEGPGQIAFESGMFNNGHVAFFGNHVSDYQIAMNAGEGEAVMAAKDNLLERCGIGIRVTRGIVDVSGNDIRDGGTGIAVVGEGFSVTNNRVIGSSEVGITVGFSDEVGGTLAHNVVGRCGGDGIFVDRQWGTSVSVVSNTSFFNGGAGLVINGPDIASDVRGNIAYGNQGSGLSTTDPDGITLACNDWFENALGAVVGTAPSSADLAVDPKFCDLAANRVTLRADSPLLASGTCGLIGAEGSGCDVSTEVLVARFEVEHSEQGVRIRWRLGGDERPVSTWIERSDHEAGPWQRIVTERSADADATIEMDRGAEADRGYWYRLAWIAASGEAHSTPIEAAGAPATIAFGLRTIGPNPTNGPVTIEYSLPRTGPVQLTIHDVMGREVARLASGVQESGRHVTRWTGESRGGQARPGLYFVRLRQAGDEQSRRFLLRQ